VVIACECALMWVGCIYCAVCGLLECCCFLYSVVVFIVLWVLSGGSSVMIVVFGWV